MKLRPRARGLSRIISASFAGQRLSSLIFIFLALALLSYSTMKPEHLSGLRAMTADIAAPALAVVNTPIQRAADYVRAVSGLAVLQEENIRLQAENARLREWYQTAMTLKMENESLQKLLNISLPPQQKFVTARVIADSGNSYVKALLVLVNRADNVRKGQTVLAGEGVIGRVVEAGDQAARVLLMTDINSRIPVLVEGSNLRAIVAGNNTDLPLLKHLPPESELTEGSRIITSGHGGLFPYGLPVGEVVKDKAGAWAVRPYADADKAIFVRITGGDTDLRLQAGGQP